MALTSGLPSNLYSGDAVVLNTKPITDFYVKQQTEKAAAQDAYGKYFQDQLSKLNDKGLSEDDIPVVNKGITDAQNYYLQNKNEISKGNTPEATQMNKIFRDVQGSIQEGLDKTKTNTILAQLPTKMPWLANNPEYVNAVASHNLPIGTPGREPINLAKFTSIEVPPLDISKYVNKNLKDIKPEYTPSTTVDPNNKFQNIESYIPKLDASSKSIIQTRVSNDYQNNPSMQKAVYDLHKPDRIGDFMNATNKFKEVYGKDPSGDVDLATGLILSGISLPPKSPTFKPNDAAKNLENDRRAARNQEYSLARQTHAAQLSLTNTQAKNPVVSSYDNTINTIKNNTAGATSALHALGQTTYTAPMEISKLGDTEARLVRARLKSAYGGKNYSDSDGFVTTNLQDGSISPVIKIDGELKTLPSISKDEWEREINGIATGVGGKKASMIQNGAKTVPTGNTKTIKKVTVQGL
jgi:hypothetical protein